MSDPVHSQHDDVERLIRLNYELTKENNRLLRKIRRNSLISTVFSLVYWALIIGVPVYVYYSYLHPYIGSLSNSYTQIKTQSNELDSLVNRLKQFQSQSSPFVPHPVATTTTATTTTATSTATSSKHTVPAGNSAQI